MGAETKVGAPCLAFLGDGWIKAKVAREDEDGTYDVTDGTADSLFDRWHGLTRDELSFDDLALFGPLFDTFRGGEQGLGRAAAGKAFADLGVEVNDENLASFWADRCKTLAPGVEPEHALQQGCLSHRGQARWGDATPLLCLSLGVAGGVDTNYTAAIDAALSLQSIAWGVKKCLESNSPNCWAVVSLPSIWTTR